MIAQRRIERICRSVLACTGSIELCLPTQCYCRIVTPLGPAKTVSTENPRGTMGHMIYALPASPVTKGKSRLMTVTFPTCHHQKCLLELLRRPTEQWIRYHLSKVWRSPGWLVPNRSLPVPMSCCAPRSIACYVLTGFQRLWSENEFVNDFSVLF